VSGDQGIFLNFAACQLEERGAAACAVTDHQVALCPIMADLGEKGLQI